MTDPKPVGWRIINDGHYTNGVFTVRKVLTQLEDSTFAYRYFLVHAKNDASISMHESLDEALKAALSATPKFGL